MHGSRLALESPKRSPGTHCITVLGDAGGFLLSCCKHSILYPLLVGSCLYLKTQPGGRPPPDLPQRMSSVGLPGGAGSQGGNPGGSGTSASHSEDPSSIMESQIIAFEHYLLQFNCIDLLPVQWSHQVYKMVNLFFFSCCHLRGAKLQSLIHASARGIPDFPRQVLWCACANLSLFQCGAGEGQKPFPLKKLPRWNIWGLVTDPSGIATLPHSPLQETGRDQPLPLYSSAGQQRAGCSSSSTSHASCHPTPSCSDDAGLHHTTSTGISDAHPPCTTHLPPSDAVSLQQSCSRQGLVAGSTVLGPALAAGREGKRFL